MSQITKPAPLGRGLSALFGDADTSYQKAGIGVPSAAVAAVVEKGPIQKLPITQLQPGEYQPRHHFDKEAIQNLSDSIRERGIIQPLIVRPIPETKDTYEIIAGERRWRAAQLAGLHEVPVVVRNIDSCEALEFGLIENIQREDLSPLEEAEGYKRLMDEFKHTQENLSSIVGKSRSHIANMMRLLSLPLAVKQMISDGKLSAGHARALVTAQDPYALAERIVKDGMNVRQAEALAKNENKNPQIHKKKSHTRDANIAALEKELSRAIGLVIGINAYTDKSGNVVIHYNNLEQMDEIIKRLKI